MLAYLPFIIAVVVLFVLIFIINRKTSRTNKAYDERQTIARNIAYKCSFTALLFYFVASELVTMFRDADWCTPECNIGIGLFVCISVFAIISIANDAYIPFSNKNKTNLIIILLLGILQLYLGISDIVEFGFMMNGILNLPVTLCVGMLMVVVVITQLIKFALDRKVGKSED